ncbi:hypothetical protein [Parasitella parasitica]|uniref:DUF4211 domain-containing protein n=1 Tax=Parasitella parasitica TaxID=35722 RepID=A0A0B7NB38_9FUNG|nr:hypothetical protein [Parasitella parasitica]
MKQLLNGNVISVPLQEQQQESSELLPSKIIENEGSQEYQPDTLVLPKKKKAPVIFDSDENDISSDEDTVLTNIPRKRKKLKQRILESSDEEDKSQNMSHMEVDDTIDIVSDDDMDDDLDFLDKSDYHLDILQERTRGKRVHKYTENLKKLKDRKSKLSQYDKVETGPIESFVNSKHHQTFVSSSEDEGDSVVDEDEFVVDDDIVDGKRVTNQATSAELPAEFSKAKLMSFKRQMNVYIQYLIDLVLVPVFDISSNPKYVLARDVVTKRVKGYRDSIVTSDVWLPNFKEDLDRYPNWLQTTHLAYDTDLVCEACRANKAASTAIKLYSDNTSESETYYLGSECSQKASIYHEFKHFETHMHQKIKNLVYDRRYKASNSKDVFENLLQTNHIKTLRRSITSLMSKSVNRYNPKGQRSQFDDSSSSDSSQDDLY